MGPLAGLRVLEVGDWGEIAGKLLADAGAEVVRVEPPGGARGRRIGPFAGDRPDVNGSLRFAYFNTNKRAVTLDLATADGGALWRRLVAAADVVIDGANPGVFDNPGLGYPAFAGQPGLIWCAVTPFGATGPWRDWAAADLVSLALGGQLWSTGYDDHTLPPMRPEGEHALWIAGEYAVQGILAALLQRRQDGLGQSIDVAMHEALSATTEWSFMRWEYNQQIVQRQTGRHATAMPTSPWQHRCSDGGYISLMGGGIPRTRAIWHGLLAWMDEEGAAEDLHEQQYEAAVFAPPEAGLPLREHVMAVIGRFVQRLPVETVYRRGQALHLPWAVIRRPEENLDDPHWADRGFFQTGELAGHPEPVRYPGAPYRFSATPLEFRRRAPLLGEHNHAVYVGELGLATADLINLSQQGVL